MGAPAPSDASSSSDDARIESVQLAPALAPSDDEASDDEAVGTL